ncbi:two-component system, chemotaxis family, response regulator CheY [Granulicella rosea]|uniref:Two-component system, chemotaxis family, response regulator CheY n=1 Tax=Granulicella rosea TaxID=474952 RepID=A0A239CX22_9BACT|nr:response regulator [Granulicella rosea]SNS23903.1 two-component system, chemotaxis family, response regulator CheY [Granulicella rosea]
MRAMIVDDSLLLRSMVERAVRAAHPAFNEFVHATDGMDAIQVLRSELRAKQKLDLIVTDTNMPKMSGLEFLERIQKEKLCVGTEIIMITTENSPTHLARAKAAGSKGNISKPFTPEMVKALLGPLFQGRR